MKLKILTHAEQLSALDWAALQSGATDNPLRDPFCSRAFLAAAERVFASDPQLGWQARHLCLSDAEGMVAALLPMYIRTHSFGVGPMPGSVPACPTTRNWSAACHLLRHQDRVCWCAPDCLEKNGLRC